jgi:hypothetical protein
MLRALLEGRIVFTPNVEERSCLFQARGNYEELFRGLISLPKAMASPTGLDTQGNVSFERDFRAA